MKSWGDLTLENIFYAYRKAKYDCFIDRTINSADKFVEYEKDIENNLTELYENLKEGKLDHYRTEKHCKILYVTKKLSSNPTSVADESNSDSKPTSVADESNSETKTKQCPHEKHSAHFFYSDKNDELVESNEYCPEFRIIGDFSVEVHVISALWINLVGVKYDAALSDDAYGSRLRRYRKDDSSNNSKPGTYQLEGLGSFYPYFSYYKKWRENGFKIIRQELDKNESVVVMTMDISSFYHRIDPSFIGDKEGFLKDAKIYPEPWELEFTQSIAELLNFWSDQVRDKIGPIDCPETKPMGGIPIGLTISRVISNCLMINFDRAIKQELTPLYYGRYVDDIILVIKNPGNISPSNDALSYIKKRLNSNGVEYLSCRNGKVRINTGSKSEIELQPNKMKTFILEGVTGLHMIDNIEEEIIRVSSVRKLLHSPSDLKSMRATKVVTTSSSDPDNIDSLRRADGVSINRLGFGMLFRDVITWAHDLEPKDWKAERQEFYNIGYKYFFAPLTIFENMKYISRYISLAVSVKDWDETIKIINKVMDSLNSVKKLKVKKILVNGYDVEINEPDSEKYVKVMEDVVDSVVQQMFEALSRSVKITVDEFGKPVFKIPEFFSLKFNDRIDKSHLKSIKPRVEDYFLCDFGVDPVQKTIYTGKTVSNENITIAASDLFEKYKYYSSVAEFAQEYLVPLVKKQNQQEISEKINQQFLKHFMFATRPLRTKEIFSIIIEKSTGEQDNPAIIDYKDDLEKYTRAIRGVWTVNENNSSEQSDESNSDTEGSCKGVQGVPKLFELSISNPKQKIFLGITNFLTEQSSWEGSICNKPDYSVMRYSRILKMVNSAIGSEPRPTYLVMPELSIPLRWIESISNRLLDQKISLIAGTEYQHIADNRIYSEATLALNTDILGYESNIVYRQIKSVPAPGEEHDMVKKYGKQWATDVDVKKKLILKPIFKHGEFTFGVLVCSELQEMKNRIHFQGHVDCLIILCWNKDLHSFSVLVESACLDVHANIALVNNRMYGESRVRSPAKKDYNRELCNIKGGKNDQLVIVEIDYNPLREFQSQSKNWPDETDEFKPVPQGFKISKLRNKY